MALHLKRFMFKRFYKQIVLKILWLKYLITYGYYPCVSFKAETTDLANTWMGWSAAKSVAFLIQVYTVPGANHQIALNWGNSNTGDGHPWVSHCLIFSRCLKTRTRTGR